MMFNIPRDREFGKDGLGDTPLNSISSPPTTHCLTYCIGLQKGAGGGGSG